MCRVVKVHDGDSFTLMWRREEDGMAVFANSRLFGIDTPELRDRDDGKRADAIRCRDMARDLLFDELLSVTTEGVTGLDKYGRPLVTLRTVPGATSVRVCDALANYDGCVNTWMLRRGPGTRAYPPSPPRRPASSDREDLDP